ncbi:hypothetical protein FAZ19_19620 [Sphingobacterium alkalisoli]|uniref:Uncharacterized protein n=1 Tax=Sphingobacterium alkalisoli TaxID=1874115 RepID=A0A4U0GUC8_9SPHI|nr:hypothetical protein [Sphingobacterium alkalisoli]TJY62680.1 hypothetical protein FAZ19_19620 [Sphingobacterium alkalisoli]GGH28179.1 hypothetical protein GCM10011418_38640 [Sphingobacterium alkalisoli]
MSNVNITVYDGKSVAEAAQRVEAVKKEVLAAIDGVKGNIAPADPAPSEDGVYKAKEAGTYANLGGLIAKEGYATYFTRKDGVWSLFSEDKTLGDVADGPGASADLPASQRFVTEVLGEIPDVSGLLEKGGYTGTAQDIHIEIQEVNESVPNITPLEQNISTLQTNKEDKSNKENYITNSYTKYPSSSAVLSALQTREVSSNKSNAIDSSSIKFPTNRAVKDYVDEKLNVVTDTRFGGVIDSSVDLTNVSQKIWFFAVPGTYQISEGELTTTAELSIIARNGSEWTVEGIYIDVTKEWVVCDTIEEMRTMNEYYIGLITSGLVKGVQLLGYYEKGDTPAPIEYYLSNTTETDDGGSIIEVGGIKLETKSKLSLQHFGGKEDSIFDSYPAFKNLVNFNNRNDYSLVVEGDFLFKGDGDDLLIYTDVDLTNANITMDPNGNIDFKIRCLPRPATVFNTQDLDESDRIIVLNAVETAINEDTKVLTGLAFEKLANRYCCLRTLTSRRTSDLVETNRLVTPQTWYKEENFFVDINGNIEGTFYNDDLDLVGNDNIANYSIRGFDYKQKREFKGGNVVYTTSNTALGSSGYRQIGFYFEGLTNLVISNPKVDLWGIKNKMFGYIRLLECYNVSVNNFSAIPANHTLTSGGSSYVLNLTDCQNLLIDKYTCPDLLNLDQWGSICGHRSYNIKYSNCVTSRIDCHYRGYDWTIEKCKIGHQGIRYSGGGRWVVKDIDVYKSPYVMGARGDYGGEFKGDIYLENITLYTLNDENNGVISIDVADDATNAYNLHPNKPNEIIPAGGYNIYMKNVKFSNALSVSLRESCFASALRVPQNSELTQNIKLPNLYVDTVNFENVGADPKKNEFSIIRFGRSYVFMKIKQGENGSNVSESSSVEKPLFKEINNQILEVRNVNFYRDSAENLLRFNQFNDSDFNNSDNKNMVPMPLIKLFECVNVSPITRVYRTKIEANNCSLSNAFSSLYTGFYSYNKWDIKGGYIFIKDFNYPMISGNSLQGDIAINNVIIDCLDSTLDARIATFLFSTTDYPSPTLTPRLWMINNYQRRVRNNYISDKLRDRLQVMSDNLVSGGNKGFTISYVESTLVGSIENYIDIIDDHSKLPTFNNSNAYSNLRILYSTSIAKEELYYDRVNFRWINQYGALAGSRKYGTTAQRPLITDVPIGYTYFDTSLSYNITSNGTTWVDATGTTV